MKIKSKLSIVAFVSCCAITSMGFANWAITQQDPIHNENGGIYAESAIISNEYISFDSATPLRVNAGGFTNPESPNSTILSGSFTATFIVYLDNYGATFTEDATTEITLKFAQTPANNIFATDNSVATIEVENENNSNLISAPVGNRSSGTFVTTLGINSSEITSDVATFTLKYTFTFTDKESYKTFIYNVFYPDGTDDNKALSTVQFAFEISIKEKAV